MYLGVKCCVLLKNTMVSLVLVYPGIKCVSGCKMLCVAKEYNGKSCACISRDQVCIWVSNVVCC